MATQIKVPKQEHITNIERNCLHKSMKNRSKRLSWRCLCVKVSLGGARASFLMILGSIFDALGRFLGDICFLCSCLSWGRLSTLRHSRRCFLFISLEHFQSISICSLVPCLWLPSDLVGSCAFNSSLYCSIS